MSWLIPGSIQSFLTTLIEYSQYYLNVPSGLSEKMKEAIQMHLAIIDELNYDKKLHLQDLHRVIKECEDEFLNIEKTSYLIPKVIRQDFVRGTDDLEVVFAGDSFVFPGISLEEEEAQREDAPQAIELILKIAQFTDQFAETNKLTPESKQDLFRNLLILQSQTVTNRGPGVFRGLMNTRLPCSQLEPLGSSKKVIWHQDGYFEVRLFYSFTVNQRREEPIYPLEAIGKLAIVTHFKLCSSEDRWEWTAPHFFQEREGPSFS